MKTIFGSHYEDFFKIYFIAFAIIPMYYFIHNAQFENAIMYMAFICDGGHVYSTYAESLFDSNENKKRYVYINIAMAFFMNWSIIVLFKEYFYYYIFYYTVYHNIKQGVGVSLLINSNKSKVILIKTITYLVTIIPFFAYHVLEAPISTSKIQFDRSLFTIVKIPNYNIPNLAYIIYLALAIVYLVLFYQMYKDRKNIKAYLSVAFFGMVYFCGFSLFNNIIYSYAILIFSHGIPYYFLMEKRLQHHTSDFFRNYSYLILAAFFLLGGLNEFFNEELTNSWIENIGVAFFWTPTIGHYMMDADIWKRDNAKMKEMAIREKH